MSTPAEMEAVSAALRKCDRATGPIIVELGAYCGEDSEWMREACGQTPFLNVMVEPDHRNCEVIRQYRRGVRTVIVEAAIADYTGMTQFNRGVDERNDGERSGS